MFEELFQQSQTALSGSPAIPGIVTGIVKENWDSNQPGKVKVEYYLGEKGKMVSRWMSVMSPYVASSAGMYFLPEIGSEVVIAFQMGRPDCPIVLGSLWSQSVPMPKEAPGEKNPTKSLKTKGGHEILFSDEEKKESLTVTTPAGLSLSMDDEKKTVTVKDKDGKNTWILNTEKGEITMNAEKKFILSIGGTAVLTVEANSLTGKSGTITWEGSQSLKLTGQTANLAGSQIQIKADASLKAESGGMTEIKGSMVKVN